VATISQRRAQQPAAKGAYRFPCGHSEEQSAVTPRIRGADAALWVACRQCCVIALAVAPPVARRPRRRSA
jgi:hypothetical protein